MEEDYIDDAEFYDGLEEDPGKPYMELRMPAWLTGGPVAEVAMPAPAPAPPAAPPARLLTPEEFMAKYNLPRPE